MAQIERDDVLRALRGGGDSLSGLCRTLDADADEVFSVIRELEYDDLVRFTGFHYGDVDGGVQPSGRIELTEAGSAAAASGGNQDPR